MVTLHYFIMSGFRGFRYTFAVSFDQPAPPWTSLWTRLFKLLSTTTTNISEYTQRILFELLRAWRLVYHRVTLERFLKSFILYLKVYTDSSGCSHKRKQQPFPQSNFIHTRFTVYIQSSSVILASTLQENWNKRNTFKAALNFNPVPGVAITIGVLVLLIW